MSENYIASMKTVRFGDVGYIAFGQIEFSDKLINMQKFRSIWNYFN